jgi:WD40 repeat protein
LETNDTVGRNNSGEGLADEERTAEPTRGDQTLKLWEVAAGKELATFTGHSDGIRSIAFSPDGRTALSGSDDKTLKLWEMARR